MKDRKKVSDLDLVLTVLTSEEVAEQMATIGAKVTHNSKSLTIRVEKNSLAWEQFALGCSLALKKKVVRKQLLQLLKEASNA